jgi:hypothetical protein
LPALYWGNQGNYECGRGGHFGNVDQFHFAVEVKNIQRDARVFHPETPQGIIRENEQHSVVLRHAVTKHQAEGLLFLCLCEFNAKSLPFQLHVRTAGHA